MKHEKEAAEQLEYSKDGKQPPKKAHVDSLIIDEEFTGRVPPEESVKKEIKVKKFTKETEAVDHLKKIDDKFEGK